MHLLLRIPSLLFIRGRYSSVSTDNDCALAASETGDLLHGNILTAELSYVGDSPGLPVVRWVLC